jgi:hypothetical protein
MEHFCSSASPEKGAGNKEQYRSHKNFNGHSNVSHLSKAVTQYLQP